MGKLLERRVWTEETLLCRIVQRIERMAGVKALLILPVAALYRPIDEIITEGNSSKSSWRIYLIHCNGKNWRCECFAFDIIE